MKLSKEAKIVMLLFTLIVLIIICKNILDFDSINYKLNVAGNKIKIKEVFKNNKYYIEIKTNKNIYPFRIYDDLDQKRKVVKEVYYYKDKNIECLLPVINKGIYTDMMCYKEEILYNYHDLKNSNISLDKYVDSIEIYNIKNYENKSDNTKTIDTVKYNIYNNMRNVVAITTYRGLISNDKKINLFEKDIYNNKLSAFINNYYIVANYENKYSFNFFYIINLDTNSINKLETKYDISYDSYIQGIVDNKMYLYDKDNENQYEIDIENNSIKIISNNEYVKHYANKKWAKLNKIKAKKEIYFDYETLDNKFTSYDYVKEVDDYYYLYKKDGISYKLYRIDKNSIESYKYLLDVPTTNIIFKNNYLYYVYKNKLYYYSDKVGLKLVLENSELEFNDTIKYYIY